MDIVKNSFEGIVYTKEFIYFIIGAAVTFFVTFIYYKKTMEGGKLAFDSSKSIIIDRETEAISSEFKLEFYDKEIIRLVRTNIYFWNNGNKTIRKEDLVKSNQLRIRFDNEVNIFSYNIVKNTDESNEMSLKKSNDSEIDLCFNYLEPNDGVKIEILHNSINASVKIDGKVIDVRNGVKRFEKLLNYRINNIFDTFALFFSRMVITSIAFLLLIVVSVISTKYKYLNWILYIGIVFFLSLPPTLGSYLDDWLTKTKTYPKNLD